MMSLNFTFVNKKPAYYCCVHSVYYAPLSLYNIGVCHVISHNLSVPGYLSEPVFLLCLCFKVYIASFCAFMSNFVICSLHSCTLKDLA